MVILRILLFIIMLGILITIHELGHFIMAKAFNVYCFEFSVGFGPKIISKKKGETIYSLRLLPLGGYVSMLGEAEEIPEEFAREDIDESRSLYKVHKAKRVGIMSAGIVMNFIIGLLIFFISNTAVRQTQIYTSLAVEEGSDAQTVYNINNNDIFIFKETKIGVDQIQYFGEGTLSNMPENEYYVLFNPRSYDDLEFSGSAIVLIDKETTNLYAEGVGKVTLTRDSILTLTAEFGRYDDVKVLQKTSKTLVIRTRLIDSKDPGKGYELGTLGFSFTKGTYFNRFGDAVKLTFKDFGTAFTAIGRGLAMIFSPGGFKNLSGPVGIYKATSSTLTNFGLSQYLFIWGLISVNLAIFNLLPFPGLDGWHILIVILESIIRREVNPKFKQIASAVGIILLLALFVVITIKDIFFILI